ncbi:Alpha/Beta hydrolase protein [Haematococcus lacustris]
MRSLRGSQHLLPVHRLLRACVPFVPDLVTSSLVAKGHSQSRAADRRQAGQHQAGSGPQQPPLLELLASLGAVYRSLAPPLSLGELVFGLQVLVKQHSSQRPQARDQLRGRRVRDPLLLHRMLDDLDLAQSCYRRQQHLAAAHCRIKIQNMVAWQPESSYLRPGYWLGVDHCQRQVVWAVRGTRFLADLITDLTSAHPYMQGHTHWGMQHAARWLLHREQARVQDLLAHLPGYRLHLVGHSLGGGIASLIAHMAHNCPQVAAQLLPPEARGQQGLPLPGWVRAVALAPPCVMTQHMAHSCRRLKR